MNHPAPKTHSNMPLVSIIMPAYNAEKFIKRAIESILSQTYTNLELWIADDASTDKTLEIISSYSDKRIRTAHNSVNLGYLKTSNKLFELANGDYITFQDADDWSESNRIQILLHEFENDPELGCAGSFVTRIDINDATIGSVEFKCEDREIRADLPNHFNCVGSALMIKRKVMQRVGLYHAYFDRIGSEDLYWHGKIVRHFKTINIPQTLYHYRYTPGSISTETHKSLKKLASKEIAVNALAYYMASGKEIFSSKLKTFSLEQYLLGKYACWNKLSRTGVKLLLKSVFIDPFSYTEKYSLLCIYLPSLLRRSA